MLIGTLCAILVTFTSCDDYDNGGSGTVKIAETIIYGVGTTSLRSVVTLLHTYMIDMDILQSRYAKMISETNT